MNDSLALDLALQGRIDAADSQVKQLVALADEMAALPDPEIDASFADALEARLLAEPIEGVTPARHLQAVEPAAAARPAPVEAPAKPKPTPVAPNSVIPLPRRRLVVRRGLVAAVAAAMLMAFPIAASANALPDSPFYSVKVAIERLQVNFAGSPVDKGFKELSLATGARLPELEQMIAKGASDEQVEAAARRLSDQFATGAALVQKHSDSADDLGRLVGIAVAVQTEVADLMPKASDSVQPALAEVVDLSAGVATEAAGTGAPAVGDLVTVEAPAVSGPKVSAPATASDGATAPSGTSSKQSGPKSTGGDSGSVRGPADKGNPGDGQYGTAADGCPIVGQANGLGDTMSPVARLACGD